MEEKVQVEKEEEEMDTEDQEGHNNQSAPHSTFRHIQINSVYTFF